MTGFYFGMAWLVLFAVAESLLHADRALPPERGSSGWWRFGAIFQGVLVGTAIFAVWRVHPALVAIPVIFLWRGYFLKYFNTRVKDCVAAEIARLKEEHGGDPRGALELLLEIKDALGDLHERREELSKEPSDPVVDAQLEQISATEEQLRQQEDRLREVANGAPRKVRLPEYPVAPLTEGEQTDLYLFTIIVLVHIAEVFFLAICTSGREGRWVLLFSLIAMVVIAVWHLYRPFRHGEVKALA